GRHRVLPRQPGRRAGAKGARACGQGRTDHGRDRLWRRTPELAAPRTGSEEPAVRDIMTATPEQQDSARFLARRMSAIKPSPSMAAKRKVDALRAEGQTIIDFTIGEPDLRTPAHIARAGIDAIERGDVKYTSSSGIRELLQAVQQK